MRPPAPESGLTVTARPTCSALGTVDMNRNVVSKCGWRSPPACPAAAAATAGTASSESAAIAAPVVQ